MFLLKKKLSLLLCFLLLLSQSDAQQPYWQQKLSYSIDVALNDQQHSLRGFMELSYTNASPDTLSFIWFHLWPNAYKNDKTAFSDQLLENGNTSFYFSEEHQRGYINQLDFKVNGITADVEDHQSHIDILKLILPQPLYPGGTVTITTPFHVQLPEIFSRSGHDGQHYQIAQWHPKPAVYDKNGWHEMPYLDQGEFYAEFADYDVRISLPDNYVVSGSGALQNEAEKEWLKERYNYIWEPTKTKVKTKGGAIKTVVEKYPPSSPKQKTLHYKIEQAHDFAWFADKRFRVDLRTLVLPSGKSVDIGVFYLQEEENSWKKMGDYAYQSLLTRSKWLGDYPYPQFNVVQSTVNTGGGMEYPGITVLAPFTDPKTLHTLVAHEAGHNWFQAALATNERATPWLDEGLNSYYDNRYSKQLFGSDGEMTLLKQPVSFQQVSELLVDHSASLRMDQPIHLASEKFSSANYNLITYAKAAQWLELIEKRLGTAIFDKAMQTYYERWKFKHPDLSDFKAVLEETGQQSLDEEFALLHQTGSLNTIEQKGIAFVFPLSKKNIRETIAGNRKQIIQVSPALGLNFYDKLMAGVAVSNISIPQKPLQFFIAPMYSTGTGKITGMANVNYNIYPSAGVFHRMELGVNWARFGINNFKDPAGKWLHFGMNKLVPNFRLTLREPTARSTRERFIHYKTFLFKEEGLRFTRDTSIVSGDTTVTDLFLNQAANRTLHQLRLVWSDNRVLYPYKASLNLEHGKSFLRAAFTAQYFFNYASGGGLKARFFAGKFFYLGPNTISKQIQTNRYHLNMTGADGGEDYTYSDYFIGRNEFEKFASQQIMERDGAFKTRTNMLASRVGRTDNWLMALNFSSTIPDRINPLSFLPVKIPLKVFADIGTYAEAWDRNANTDRFLFDAGLQISMLKETVHFYLPLIYSQPFKDYIVSTIPKKERLLRKISFTIDISNFNIRQQSRQLLF